MQNTNQFSIDNYQKDQKFELEMIRIIFIIIRNSSVVLTSVNLILSNSFFTYDKRE